MHAAQTLTPTELPSRVAVVRMPLTEFAKRVGVTVGIAVAAGAVIMMLWVGGSLLALLFAGVLFGVLLRALSEGVGRVLGISASWSLSVVLVGLLALLIGGGVWLAPNVSSQLGQLTETIPSAVEDVRRQISRYQIGEWMLRNTPELDALMPESGRIVDRVTGLLHGGLGFIISVAVVLFVGIYLAASPQLYACGVVRLVPVRHRARAEGLLSKLYQTLKWWLIGKGITMAAVGVVVGIGLWAAGLDVYLALGVFAGLSDFIPNFGPYIGAAPAVLVALGEDGTTVLWVIGVFVLAQSLEGYVLTPIIQQRTVHLPPALTIAAQLVLGVLLGAIGVVIAAPATAAGLVIVKELYVKDTLGDASIVEEKEEKKPGGAGDSRPEREASGAAEPEHAVDRSR